MARALAAHKRTVPGMRVPPDKALWGAENQYIKTTHGYPLPDLRLARRKLSKGGRMRRYVVLVLLVLLALLLRGDSRP